MRYYYIYKPTYEGGLKRVGGALGSSPKNAVRRFQQLLGKGNEWYYKTLIVILAKAESVYTEPD